MIGWFILLFSRPGGLQDRENYGGVSVVFVIAPVARGIHHEHINSAIFILFFCALCVCLLAVRSPFFGSVFRIRRGGDVLLLYHP